MLELRQRALVAHARAARRGAPLVEVRRQAHAWRLVGEVKVDEVRGEAAAQHPAALLRPQLRHRERRLEKVREVAPMVRRLGEQVEQAAE